MLQLDKLIEMTGNKNDKVIATGETILTEGECTGEFNDLYGGLCGGSNQGLIQEESQETLFELSGIAVIELNSEHATLSQNNKRYYLEVVVGTEGCEEADLHYNFNTLVELKEDDTTKRIVSALVELNKLTREVDLNTEMNILKELDTIAEKFEVVNELSSALDIEQSLQV